MATTINTGVNVVSNGQTTNIDLRGYSSLDSALIRWVGRDTVITESATLSNNSSVVIPGGVTITVPNIPTGYSFSHLKIDIQAANVFDTPIEGVQLGIITPNGTLSQVSKGTIAGYGIATHTYTSYNSSDYTGICQGLITSYRSGEGCIIGIWATVYYTKTNKTTNPAVRCNFQNSIYTGTLNNGILSGWITLNGLIIGQINTLNHSIQGSLTAYVEIEYTVSMKPTVVSNEAIDVSYTVGKMVGTVQNTGGSAVIAGFEYGSTPSYGSSVSKGTPTLNVPFTHQLTTLGYNVTSYYRAYATNTDGTSYGEQKQFTTLYPYLLAPVRTLPENESRITERKPYFTFSLPENTNNSATKYHARVRLSEYVDLQNATTFDSSISQIGWQVYNGSTWDAFPSGGVDADSVVRYQPQENLILATLYWDATSFDGTEFGITSTVWSFRIVLTINGLYTLSIDNVEYNAFELSIKETSNGQVGEIRALLSNVDGATNIAINYGDIILVAVNDVYGNSEEYKGVVKSKSAKNFAIEIMGTTGSGILGERRIKEDYTSQDIGLTVKDIIDTYCDPLTSTNVNTSTGISAPITALDKSPITVLEEIRRQYGIMYFIDKDWDMHLYLPTSISDAYTTIISGEVI